MDVGRRHETPEFRDKGTIHGPASSMSFIVVLVSFVPMGATESVSV